MALDLRQLHDTTTRRFDRLVVSLMDSVGITFARSALGLVFIWFGALKTFGELSPAYDLVAATVYWFTPEIVVPILGIWEVLIGVAFLVPSRTRIALLLLLPQMPGTFLPLIMLPEVCFTVAPFGLTLRASTSSRTSSSSPVPSSSVERHCAAPTLSRPPHRPCSTRRPLPEPDPRRSPTRQRKSASHQPVGSFWCRLSRTYPQPTLRPL